MYVGKPCVFINLIILSTKKEKVMKSKRFLSFLSLVLVLATLFVGCGETNQFDVPSSDGQGQKDASDCAHAQTVVKNAVEASCTEKGYTGDTVCSDCGAVVSLGVETDYAHVWDEGSVTKEPTCMEVGILTHTCTLCAATMGESIPTVEHKSVYHDAQDGTHNLTCEMCVMSEYEEHVPVDPAGKWYAASCTEPAYTRYKCSLCEKYYKVYSESEDDKETGHSWGEWTGSVPATCSREGKKTHQCGSCGYSETVNVPCAPSKHTFEEISRQESTCTVAGTASFKCKYCPETETRPLPLASHSLVESQPGADGWTHSRCENCDYTVSSFNASDVASAEVSSSALNTDKSFEITTNAATVEFPKEVVEQMTQGSSSVKIDAGVLDDQDKKAALDDASNLTDEQKDRLKDVDIFNFGVDTVTGNFDAKVTVKIPYTLKKGEEPDGIIIWFVGEDGIQSIEAVYADGFVTFEAEHFSYYAVAYEETQEMKCRRGFHDFEITDVTFAPTCEHYGYTVYECKCCHITDIKDVVAKLDHDYSELTAPTVTCDVGGYWHKTCSKCGDVKNFTYVRATGHKISKRATCTEDAICSTCKEVAEFAHGHSFSEWKTVKEPTDVKAGERRRNCTACGTIESVKIAPTGNIDQYDFTGYQQMMEFVLSDILHFENGTVSLKAKMNTSTYDMDLTIEKQGTSYVMLIDVVEGYYRRYETPNGKPSKDEWVEKEYHFVYRDGVIVVVNGYYDEGVVSNLDSINGELPFEIFMKYIEQTFDYYAPTLESSFDEIVELLDVVDRLAAPELNEMFKKLELDMEMSDLSEIFEKLRVLYAYNAQKLGFKTTIEIEGEVPTALDFLDVLSDYMTESKGENGQTLYTFDMEQILDAYEIVLNWLEENENETLADIIYESIGEDISDIYPNAKDWDGLIKELKKNFTSNMKLNKAVDKLIAMLEAKDVVKVGDFYKLLEALCFELTGEKVNIEQYIKKSTNDATLAEFVDDVFGYDTTEQFWDALDEYCTGTYFGDYAIEYHYEYDPATGKSNRIPYTVSDFVDDAREALDGYEQESQFVLVVDENGYIVSLDYDMAYSYEDEDVECTYDLAVKADKSVKVVIPEEYEALLGVKVTMSYAANGDLIVTVPKGYDYDFNIAGSGRVDLSLMIERDDTLSAKLGYDVYVLKKEYWDSYESVGRLYEVDGKYYEYSYKGTSSFNIVNDMMSLSEIQDDWQSILPDEDDEPDGYLSNDRNVDVYSTVLGPVYKGEDGEWIIGTEYHSDRYYEENGYKYRYYIQKSAVAGDVLSEVQISNTWGNNCYVQTYYLDESQTEKISVYRMYMSLKDYDETIEVYVYVARDGQIMLVSTAWSYGRDVCVLEKEIKDLSDYCEYDFLEKYENHVENLVDVNGNEITSTVYGVTLFRYYPDYYVKVDDNKYVSFSGNTDEYEDRPSHYEDNGTTTIFNTAGKETITLPSGKTMYVVKKMDSIVFGYTKLASNLYVQTACYYDGKNIKEVVYRGEMSSRYMSFDKFLDISKYTSVNGNVYTIDADAIAILKDLCKLEGSSFSIYAQAMTTVGEIEYQINDLVYAYMIPYEVMFSTSQMEDITRPAWGEIFGYDSSYPKFMVTPNRNGSITVTTDDSEVSVYYSNDFYEDQYVTDGMVELDDAKTKEYGMDVYKGAELYSENYVQKDGKYYEFSTYGVLNYSVENDLKKLIAENWFIRSLWYGYEADIDGTRVPVYSGDVSFCSGQYFHNSMRVFFAVDDGKLCVLAGAEILSDSMIKFEELVVVNEYFETIAKHAEIRHKSDYKELYYDKYLNELEIMQYNIVIDCGDDMYGDRYDLYVYGFEDGRFLSHAEQIDSFVVLGDEVAVDNIYRIEYRYTQNYANGTFERIEARLIREEYFVKILGKYYAVGTGNWDDYLVRRVTYEKVASRLGSTIYCYGVEENGEIKYYQTKSYNYSEGYITLSDPLTYDAEKTVFIKRDYNYGTTEGGADVYEYTCISMEDLIYEKLTDGSVFIHREGDSDGYLSCSDGYYINAYKVSDSEDGSEFVSLEIEPARVYGSTFDYLLDKYITVDGLSMTIDKKILKVIDALSEQSKQNFKIKFGTYEYGNCFELDYEDLTGWFEIAQKQNSSGKYYTYNPSSGKYMPE